MNSSEFEFINKLIAELNTRQGWNNPEDLSQRDFEFLIEAVYAKTKSQISLSTIKRIWDHKYQYLPRVSTLDILCEYLGYENWNQYKRAVGINDFTENSNSSRSRIKTRTISWSPIKISIYVLIVALAVFLIALISGNSKNDYTKASFTVEKIVGDDVPATVIFSYDVSEVEFDSAFIQLSWNKLERLPLSRDENTLTSMYYIPGIHEAKLIINDSIVQTQYVYIENDSWLTLFRNEPEDIIPIYIESDDVYNDGYIHASTSLLHDFKADTSQESYYVSYLIGKDFGVTGDDFSFETSIKNPTAGGKFYCQYSSIYIYGERGGIYLTLNQPGCVGSTGIVVGDKMISGRKNDLSKLGKDFSNWQNIKGLVHNKVFELSINDTLVYETDYSLEIGRILTWQYFFMGNGAVDNLYLFNSEKDTVLLEDF